MCNTSNMLFYNWNLYNYTRSFALSGTLYLLSSIMYGILVIQNIRKGE